MKNVLLRVAILAVSALMLAFTVHTFQQPERWDVAYYQKNMILCMVDSTDATRAALNKVHTTNMKSAYMQFNTIVDTLA